MKYISVNDYLKDKYGEKIYKVSIDGGFSCPNRDGSLGNRGCIFCSGMGSGDFAARRGKSVTEQIEEGKSRVDDKKPQKYLAYFQAFTNTYAPVEILKEKFTEAINHPDIVGLSIATRPDCLPDEVVELIGQLNRIKPVWVELGLQTIHEKTAEYIRRGYSLEVFDRAVNKLKAVGIEQIIVHVILGLPGESRDMMLQSVDYVGKSGATGIKLQLLHVLKNTDLAEEYSKGKFKTLEMDEYIFIVGECLKILPKDMVIHRITGDGPKKDLIAPLWSGDKKRVLNSMKKYIDSL